MQKLLVYGSLRKGDYNYERIKSYFGENSINKIEEKILPNYNIYSLGSYPGINESENSNDTVTFDVLEVSNEAYDFIKQMELGAGYIEKQVDDCILYIYNDSLSHYKKIESGDWLQFKNLN